MTKKQKQPATAPTKPKADPVQKLVNRNVARLCAELWEGHAADLLFESRQPKTSIYAGNSLRARATDARHHAADYRRTAATL